ncbi:MAG TPA: polysaccharide ABC transporter ATP-binding protein [Planctomycetota bacterium]|nr:polysaccharide ABC transporter ATP-binding protein [Planctomycetota bacterium]
MSRKSIEVEGVGKTYRIYGNPYHRLVERLPWVKRKYHQEVRALHDITFSVEPGQCVGMIGKNGAGKSTLLKILTGTTYPTTGRYTVRGKVSALLELGAGFHQDFTGRENIYMNAAMMGFSRKEARAKFEEILDFSELHAFIDAPVRTYSSGMGARLGFSVAVATDPDVLIIDEILGVGDMAFQRKCVDKIWSYKARGKTMFFCSHSLYDVRQICEQAIWLRDGRVNLMGDAVTVTNEYATWDSPMRDKPDQAGYEDLPAAGEFDPANPPDDDQHPRIVSAQLVDPKTGQPRDIFAPGEAVAVRVRVRNSRRPQKLALAIGAMRSEGTLCFAHSTQFEGVTLEHEEFIVTLTLDHLRLLSGEFNVPIWLFDDRGLHRFHERPAEQKLIVQNRTKDLGLFLQDHSWQVERVPGSVFQ